MSVSDLQPSKLGSKEHWDHVYHTELANFQEHGDEGEIWCGRRFGLQSVEKMVKWALQHVPPSQNPSILEVGSGNGTLLFGLADAGYDGSLLCGIDYSPDAVNLARAIGAASDTGATITFAECDFLVADPPRNRWNLLLDKGTFDAIALAEKDADGKSPAARYPARVARLLKPGASFLITSCNFTEDELRASFETPETGLVYHSRIQHKTFTFGGKSGSPVSSVAFTRL
ncbi:S-adenosyl-L-methionine-dependent methyltransferase [Mycena albidolilacea]|uniref:Protein-lysine N-methyltransferase EFM4 n=1 Tax=Mycena albidolilacea TaxID=1033008 RepID=A0AAD7F409_9AGAR|nr:S-adenosyl-L-methionine-dependent methyltransferase [Mycena albidolilacea]